MGALSDLLRLARERTEGADLSYAGALTPTEACRVWQSAPGAKLVDVRTRAEQDFVGRIPGAVEIEWLRYPGGAENPYFLRQLSAEVDKEALVLFICRSGRRSDLAATAATAHGFTACYNVLEGFEGELDANRQRGKVGGWRLAGLPWASDFGGSALLFGK
ncbi:MAG: rhodanese-like domain-containing protein [Zoogloeaceae bacterium]|jgi:rhodanese-related sulfurtransferase|nr:rhodanese-like domain-containing protein [Zoogloeaceae bacterium]